MYIECNGIESLGRLVEELELMVFAELVGEQQRRILLPSACNHSDEVCVHS